MKYYIFKGRFQPFHNGHLQVVNKVLDMLKQGDMLVIAAMCRFDYPIDIIDKDFSEEAFEHTLPERNPWGSVVALEAISEVSKVLSGKHKIITTLMPYPNLAWNIIKMWFPANRVWVIPDAGESFDDAKEKFYESQGEKVIRIVDDSNISGRELRDYYYAKNSHDFFTGVPEFLHSIYWKSKV